MNNYLIRNKCIICNDYLKNTFFERDLCIPIACYLNNTQEDSSVCIPYNVYTCSSCKTSQTKYIGDLNIIYKHNHADSTGNIMQKLHVFVSQILKKYIDNIHNITEIGSSYGILSNIILENYKIPKYYIIEPSFMGIIKENHVIINDYFENVDYNQYNDSNTIIISHVFEHFYNPIETLNKIKHNLNIEYVLLVWPDLEYYKDNHTYHLLNTEHTFYVDNNLIQILFNNNTFEMIENQKYENHSVIYLFKRNNNLETKTIENINYSIDNYFNYILNKKEEINEFIKKNKDNNKKLCIWPASVHTQFILMILQINDNIDFVLDNSVNKINKYLYGYNLKCKSFEDNCNDDNNAIILNGGCFNKEVANKININKEQYIII